jgi:hypothetical protein
MRIGWAPTHIESTFPCFRKSSGSFNTIPERLKADAAVFALWSNVGRIARERRL